MPVRVLRIPSSNPFQIDQESLDRKEWDNFWFKLGGIIRESVYLTNLWKNELSWIKNLGFISLEMDMYKRVNLDIQGKTELKRKWVSNINKELSQYSTFNHHRLLVNDVRTELMQYALYWPYSYNSRIHILGSEKETLLNYETLVSKMPLNGRIDDRFIYFNMNEDLLNLKVGDSCSNLNIDIHKKSIFSTSLRHLIMDFIYDEDLMPGQKKNAINFYSVVKDYDMVFYFGSYPGVGWERALEYKRKVLVIAFDLSYNRDMEAVCLSDENLIYRRKMEIDLEGGIPPNILREIELIRDTHYVDLRDFQNRVVIINDMRREYDKEVVGKEEYENILSKEQIKMDRFNFNIMEQLEGDIGIFKIRINSLVVENCYCNYLFYPPSHYMSREDKTYLNSSELIGVLYKDHLKQIKYDKAILIKINEWRLDIFSKYRHDDLLFATNLLGLTLMPFDFLNETYGRKDLIIALYCLTDSRNDKEKVISFLANNDVIGVASFGRGKTTEHRFIDSNYNVIKYVDTEINVGGLIQMRDFEDKNGRPYVFYNMYTLSQIKYSGLQRSFRFFMRLERRKHIEDLLLRNDFYIKEIYQIEVVPFGIYAYNELRKRSCREIGKWSHVVLDSNVNDDLTKEIILEKYLSLSGHVVRLLMINKWVPFNPNSYLLLILWSFARIKKYYVKRCIFDLLLESKKFKRSKSEKVLKKVGMQLDTIAFMKKENWHHLDEWLGGIRVFELWLELQDDQLFEESGVLLADMYREVLKYFLKRKKIENIYGFEMVDISKEYGSQS